MLKKIIAAAILTSAIYICPAQNQLATAPANSKDGKTPANSKEVKADASKEVKPETIKNVKSDVPNNIYSFTVEALDGGKIDFSTFKGKKILIVNTASKCGYTPQYEELEKLYETYKDKLVIVGFPANNFGGQEPGTNSEIKEFCKKNYGVSFPMAAKVSVKGDDIAPIYKWLCNKTENGVLDATIKWNFGKFLLDENGNLVTYFPSKVTPLSDEIKKMLGLSSDDAKALPVAAPLAKEQ